MALILTNADVIGRLPMIADEFLKANSGNTTTLVNSDLTDNDYSNAYVCFLSGANIGVDSIITNHDLGTGTLTFDVIPSAVDNTTLFAITERGFQGFVLQAELYMDNYFRNNGLDLSLFLTVSQIKEAHLYKTLSLICGSRMRDGDDEDIYYINYTMYENLYNTEMSKLVADYDSNEDGSISDEEENQQLSQIQLVR